MPKKNIIKELKYLFDCESDKELSNLLKVSYNALHDWKTNTPPNIQSLLEFIKKQQLEILKLKRKVMNGI